MAACLGAMHFSNLSIICFGQNKCASTVRALRAAVRRNLPTGLFLSSKYLREAAAAPAEALSAFARREIFARRGARIHQWRLALWR